MKVGSFISDKVERHNGQKKLQGRLEFPPRYSSQHLGKLSNQATPFSGVRLSAHV